MSGAPMTNKYDWARRLLPFDLSGERWRVLFSVKEIHRGEVAEVSVTAIAKMTGLNRRTVARHLKASETESLIAVEWSKGGRAPHRIRLLEPTATPVLLRHPECRSSEDVYCDTLAVAATATAHACARKLPSTLGAAPGADPLIEAVPTSTVVGREIVSPSPNARLGRAGEEAKQTGIVAPVATAEIDARGRTLFSAEFDPAIAADEIDDAEPTISERVENLVEEISSLIADRVVLPEELVAFIDRDLDPEEDELAILEEIAASTLDKERERVQRHNDEIEAAQAAVAARRAEAPLSERINDTDHRAAYVDKLASYLVTLDREARWASSRRYRAKIVDELKRTLPRFRADALASDLTDEVLTEIARRERTSATESMLVFGALPFSSTSSGSVDHGV